ncbi:LysR family transcriptional regulator [Desulfitobacterium hafniense]|uniref:LysR family transcriptional regulator n=1 Tax=Desulfitobacterium hafniense TaxID=49338 RepID=UPI00037850F7|nr:LysR family transcriptional regulator [Desulfitobacterium hafniense]
MGKIEIKQIYYFVEVAKCGSLTKAAKVLFVTPQALSKSISQLEKEYNCQFFIRKNHNLILSNSGRQFLIDAKALLEHYHSVDRRVKELSGIEPGYLRVAAAPDSLGSLDIDLFKKFRHLYPQLNSDYIELPDKIVEEYIETDQVDVCFNINKLPNQNEYESILLLHSELCVVTRCNNNFLNNRDYVTLKDLENKKIVMKGELFKKFDILEKAAQTENITLNYELTSDTTLVLDRIASPGCIGIGNYAYRYVPKNLDDKAVPFKPPLPWDVYLSYKKYKPLSKPVQLFIKFIKENYGL